MEMEIEAAADHGVNVFIYDWYWYDKRPFLEQCLNDGFLKAKNRDKMKFFLMWANHDANYLWDIRNSHLHDNVVWSGAVGRADFEYAVDRVIDQYFFQPNYYKIGGKPVFQIYDLSNMLGGLGGTAQTRKAFEWMNSRCIQKGLQGVYLLNTIVKKINGNLTGVDNAAAGLSAGQIENLGFAGSTHYQYCHFLDVTQDYTAVTEQAAREWILAEQAYQIPYYPHISVGWDNNPRFLGRCSCILDNNTPENFEISLKNAKNYIDAHPGQLPLITINSWNEWTETSYLEPDDLHGYGYLQAIKRVFAGQVNADIHLHEPGGAGAVKTG